MGVYKTITPNEQTKVLIWKIEESFEKLCKGVELTDYCQSRVDSMKSDWHRRGFMSIRHLMAEEGLADADIEYGAQGKPHLKSETQFISITHSYNFSGIILSDRPVGIDIEKQRDKVLRIARKFTTIPESHHLANREALIRKLSVVWGAKESLYKLHGIPGLRFLNDIQIDDFDLTSGALKARVFACSQPQNHNLEFLEFDGFTGVYSVG